MHLCAYIRGLWYPQVKGTMEEALTTAHDQNSASEVSPRLVPALGGQHPGPTVQVRADEMCHSPGVVVDISNNMDCVTWQMKGRPRGKINQDETGEESASGVITWASSTSTLKFI